MAVCGMEVMLTLRNLWESDFLSELRFKWREAGVTTNLGYTRCMAAPVSHQSAGSLTEILKSLAAVPPPWVLPWVSRLYDVVWMMCRCVCIVFHSYSKYIIDGNRGWGEDYSHFNLHSYYHQSLYIFIIISLHSCLMSAAYSAFYLLLMENSNDKL